ncbi:choice-of-anchor D domain-containing protein, partial [candidate division KSB1 bacterium]|nr:choice-of-anchor D domain-containing protein [candidate division KSB1 bacterium]
GGDTLRVTSMVIDNPVFTTSATPFELTCDSTQKVPVTFTSNAIGSFVGKLTFTSNGGTKTVVLIGEGIGPEIAATPNPLPFGVVCDTTYLPLTISNSGKVALQVDTLIFTNPAFFTAPPTSFTIPANGQKIVNVGYAPTLNQPATGNLLIVSNAVNEDTLVVALSGQGGVPDIAGDTEAVFDPVEVQICAGDTNDATFYYWIKNTGTCDLKISELLTNAPFAVADPTMPQTIKPGDSLRVTLVFTPLAAGSFGDTLRVFSNDPDSSENPFKVVLRGEGVTQPDIAVSPDTLDFGAVTIGSTAWLPDTVRNVGEKALAVVEISFTNPVFATETREFSLKCNEDSVLTIAFTPKAAVAYLDTLWIVSNDPDENPAMVILKGNGTPPPPPPRGCIVVSPDSANFGTLCDLDSAMFVVSDTCAGPLKVSNLVFTNPAFGTKHPSGFTILPGKSDTIWVYFQPRVAKSDTGSLLIYSDAENDTLVSVPLEGAGGAPDIAGESHAPPFPDVKVETCSGGDNRNTVIYKLLNVGSCSLTVHSFKVNPPFSVADPKPPFKISKQGSTDVVLIFEPETSKTFIDTLYVYSDDPDEPVFKVVLQGKGVFLPHIEVKPAALNFDSTKVGSSAELPLTIRNLGAALLTVDNLVISNLAVFGIDTKEFSLKCNEDSVLTVAFSPKEAKGYVDTLWIWHNDNNNTNPFPVPLSGVGMLGALAICDSITFNESCVGNTTENSCTITNIGTADFNITSVMLASERRGDDGLKASGFAIVSVGLTGSLAVESSKEIRVAFTAKSIDRITDTLLISTDLPAPNDRLSIPLAGSARNDNPEIEITPLLSFKGQLDMETPVQPVLIKNLGCQVLKLDSIILRDSTHFLIKKHPEKRELALNESATVLVSFKGDNFTVFTDELIVLNNDPSQPQDTTKLKGEVKDGRICFEISPQTVDFQKVNVKRRSDPMEVKLINCSRTTRLHIKISPPRLQDDFAVNKMEFTSIPDPDSGRKVESIYVTFTPQAIGVREDVLELLITVPNPDGGVLKDSVAYIYLKGEGIGDPEKVEVVSNVVTPNDDEFNEETIIEYSEKKYPEAVLHIFDLRGLPVRVFRRPTGPNQFAWNGRDENGGLVLPSVYLWIMESDGKRVASGRFVVIR